MPLKLRKAQFQAEINAMNQGSLGLVINAPSDLILHLQDLSHLPVPTP